jgi:outer membrane protein assembly factor BamE
VNTGTMLPYLAQLENPAFRVSSAPISPPATPMQKLLTRKLLFAAALATATIAVSTTGCGILYKQPIYQGNLIEKTAADQLQVGMSKQQVQTLLGTPSIADPFHHGRWDYAASERTDRSGHTQVKNLTVWFDGDSLTKWDGQYFPEQDEALVKAMSKFGNLPKDKDKAKKKR